MPRGVSVCRKGSDNLLTNRHVYNADGLCKRCGCKRARRSRWFFGQEVIGDWMYLDIVTQAWGTDLSAKRELVRCARNGRIEVWKDGHWLDDEYTGFTDHQQRSIRYRCYGSTYFVIPVYSTLEHVPRMRKGDRFRVEGSAEHDGLWQCDTYREQRLVAHRILPDYSHGIPQQYRIRNESWPIKTSE